MKKTKKILYNFLDYVKSNRRDYVTTMMDVVVYALVKLLKKKLPRNYMVNQQQLNETGFNQYWSKMFAEIVDDLDEKQRDILIKKFGLDSPIPIFEDVSEQTLEEQINMDLIGLYANSSNFIKVSNGTDLIRFEVGFDALRISLMNHAKSTNSFTSFIESIQHFIGDKLTAFDIEMLYNQYIKHYDSTVLIDELNTLINDGNVRE